LFNSYSRITYLSHPLKSLKTLQTGVLSSNPQKNRQFLAVFMLFIASAIALRSAGALFSMPASAAATASTVASLFFLIFHDDYY
jgi:hypothetical protein